MQASEAKQAEPLSTFGSAADVDYKVVSDSYFVNFSIT